MRRLLLQPNASLPDQTYVELVRSLFAMLLPSVVMSLLFVGLATLAVCVTGDLMLLALSVAGTVLSMLRLRTVVTCRRRGVTIQIADRGSASAHERRFGLFYTSFAATLGLFGARAMTLADGGLHTVVVALLVGYAAGVAAGIALRPRIAGACILLAVVPSAIVCLASLQTYQIALAVVLLALLAGGLQNMQARYLTELQKIELRRAMSGLARRDPLTGLQNRLGLSEQFDEISASGAPDRFMALHCLDLDRFKPVNDHYGHLAGDELLRIVGQRLSGSLRRGDCAARIGGDEFVILQRGMRHPDEADILARRLSASLGEVYEVGEHAVTVGVSIGYVVALCGEPLDELLAKADDALYAIKAIGGGAARHGQTRFEKTTVAS